MQNINTIIFDLGNVIIDIDVGRTVAAFNALNAGDFRRIFNIGEQIKLYSQHEIGKISDEEFRLGVCQLLNVQIEAAAFDDAFTQMLLPLDPKRLEFLKQLRSRYRLFLFSNTNAIHMAGFSKRLQQDFGIKDLSPYFDKLYYSFQMGMRKPDAAAFTHIINEQKLIPQQTLFIDDLVDNIHGAASVGLQTLHLTQGKTLLDINCQSLASYQGTDIDGQS